MKQQTSKTSEAGFPQKISGIIGAVLLSVSIISAALILVNHPLSVRFIDDQSDETADLSMSDYLSSEVDEIPLSENMDFIQSEVFDESEPLDIDLSQEEYGLDTMDSVELDWAIDENADGNETISLVSLGEIAEMDADYNGNEETGSANPSGYAEDSICSQKAEPGSTSGKDFAESTTKQAEEIYSISPSQCSQTDIPPVSESEKAKEDVEGNEESPIDQSSFLSNPQPDSFPTTNSEQSEPITENQPQTEEVGRYSLDNSETENPLQIENEENTDVKEGKEIQISQNSDEGSAQENLTAIQSESDSSPSDKTKGSGNIEAENQNPEQENTDSQLETKANQFDAAGLTDYTLETVMEGPFYIENGQEQYAVIKWTKQIELTDVQKQMSLRFGLINDPVFNVPGIEIQVDLDLFRKDEKSLDGKDQCTRFMSLNFTKKTSLCNNSKLSIQDFGGIQLTVSIQIPRDQWENIDNYSRNLQLSMKEETMEQFQKLLNFQIQFL